MVQIPAQYLGQTVACGACGTAFQLGPAPAPPPPAPAPVPAPAPAMPPMPAPLPPPPIPRPNRPGSGVMPGTLPPPPMPAPSRGTPGDQITQPTIGDPVPMPMPARLPPPPGSAPTGSMPARPADLSPSRAQGGEQITQPTIGDPMMAPAPPASRPAAGPVPVPVPVPAPAAAPKVEVVKPAKPREPDSLPDLRALGSAPPVTRVYQNAPTTSPWLMYGLPGFLAVGLLTVGLMYLLGNSDPPPPKPPEEPARVITPQDAPKQLVIGEPLAIPVENPAALPPIFTGRDRNILILRADGSAVEHSAEDGRLLHEYTAESISLLRGFKVVATAACGRTGIVALLGENRAVFLKTGDGEAAGQMRFENEDKWQATACTFVYDDDETKLTHLFVGDNRGRLHIVRPADQRAETWSFASAGIARRAPDDADAVSALICDARGQRMIVGHRNGILQQQMVRTDLNAFALLPKPGRPVVRVSAERSRLTAPERRLVVVDDRGRVEIWKSGKDAMEPDRTYQDKLFDAAVSEAWPLLAGRDAEGRLGVWRMDPGSDGQALIGLLPSAPAVRRPPPGRMVPVWHPAVQHRMVAALTPDNRVLVWTIEAK